MNPTEHKNEWIQDADLIWGSLPKLKQYLEDIEFNLVVSIKSRAEFNTEFNKEMVFGLTKASLILKERIKEMTNG